jgi:hypothetical protein
MIVWVSIVVDPQTLSIILASAGVLAAAVYYILQIRHQTRMRQTDLFVRLAPWLNIGSSELQQALVKIMNLEFKDYDDFVKKYGPPMAEKPEQMAIVTFGNYFEALGSLMRRKLLDPKLVWDYWGETYITLYEKLKPIFRHYFKEEGLEESAGTYLYNELKKRQGSLRTR